MDFQVPFDEISSLEFNKEEDVPKQIIVLPPKKEDSELTLSFKYNSVYIFPQEQFKCKEIKIKEKKITLKNFHIDCLFAVSDSEITLENCEFNIKNPDEATLFSFSKLNVNDSKFISTKIILIKSHVNFNNSEFTCGSKEEACCVQAAGCDLCISRCNFHDIDSKVIYTEISTILIEHSKFSNISDTAVSITTNSESILIDNQFDHCNYSNIYIIESFKNTIKDSSFSNAKETAVCISHSSCNFDNVKLENIGGNAIYGNNGSHFEVRGATITGTQYPSIILINNTDCFLDDVNVRDTTESAIVLRCNCSITAKNVNITNQKSVGIKISDSREVKFTNVKVQGCGCDCVNLCDFAQASFDHCEFGDANEYVINVFTGAEIVLNNCLIFGKSLSPMYIHRGGSAQIDGLIFADTQLDISTIKIPSDNSGERSLKDMCKIETSRPIFAVRNYVVGDLKSFNSIINSDSISVQFDQSPFAKAKCLICSKEFDDCHLIPCGHCCYCMDCWNKFDKKPDSCPVGRLL